MSARLNKYRKLQALMLHAKYIFGVTAASGNNQLIPNISRVCCSIHDKTRFVLDRDRESTDIGFQE